MLILLQVSCSDLTSPPKAQTAFSMAENHHCHHHHHHRLFVDFHYCMDSACRLHAKVAYQFDNFPGPDHQHLTFLRLTFKPQGKHYSPLQPVVTLPYGCAQV